MLGMELNFQTHSNHWRRIHRAVCLLSVMLISMTTPAVRPAWAQSDTPPAVDSETPSPVGSNSARTPRSERTLEYWAQQLSHDRFLRRQSAERHLIGGGQASIPVLQNMLGNGDLETAENVISILAKIGEDEEPWQTDGAIATLERIAENSFGTKATLAKSTLQSFAESRGREARLQLGAAGVYVGPQIVALGSRSRERDIVRIDSRFNGKIETLAWLRWITGIHFVLITDGMATPDVLEAVTKLPQLSTLVLVDGELSVTALQKLQSDVRLDAIELRYIPLDSERLAKLSELPLRNSLYLMGTGVTEQRVQKMRMELPGLEITQRRGGFLGVICRTALENVCEVSEVMPGSGAEDAGMRAGDIVIGIDDERITEFDDLQRHVNSHDPGDQIAIRYRRNGEVFQTTATLKKLGNQ